MKILAIGDFHGEFPKSLHKVVRKEKIDVVISNGDYFPFHYRDLWFKHCYTKPVNLWDVIGKRKYQQLVLKDLRLGQRSLRGLNSLPVPVFTVVGNVDYSHFNDQYDLDKYFGKEKKPKVWKWNEQDFFTPIIKKYFNIKRIDYRTVMFRDFILIGAMGGSNPGMPTSKAFRKHRKLLDKLFKENKNKKIIFVSHNVPYNTKLDLITSRKAHKKVHGKHFGSKLIRRTVSKWQPKIHIGGHIHEGRGTQKIGRTLCINPGSVHDKEAAIVDLQNKKLKVKLIKL